TLLAHLLHERNLSLTNFLETPDYTQVWAEDIALNLFDRIYLRQLDQIQRSLLQAFFVYREPVSFAAAQVAMEDDTHSTSIIQEQYLFDDLKRWGDNFILLELYQLLLPLEKWYPDSSQIIQININLARVYRTIGQREQALECLEKSLSISRAIGNLRGEGQSL